jgi:hypothetical protein
VKHAAKASRCSAATRRTSCQRDQPPAARTASACGVPRT